MLQIAWYLRKTRGSIYFRLTGLDGMWNTFSCLFVDIDKMNQINAMVFKYPNSLTVSEIKTLNSTNWWIDLGAA